MGRYAIALWQPAELGHEGIVKMLLEGGVQPGKTPALHYAAEYDYYNVARLPVENGADVDTRGGKYRTPLACWDGRWRLMELLLERGVDPNLQVGGLYECALHIACSFSAVENAKLLLEAGAGIDIPEEFGTALQIAATRGSETLVKLMPGEENTGQHYKQQQKSAIARILLEAGGRR